MLKQRTTLGLAIGALVVGVTVHSNGAATAGSESSWSTAATTKRLDHAEDLSQTAADLEYTSHTTQDLDALSPDDAWSVGSQTARDSAWARHWDGRRWTAVRTPIIHRAEFDGVDMLTSDNVWAVGSWDTPDSGGFGGALVEHWDGSRWRFVDSPRLVGFSHLHAVEAVSANDIWAVGAASSPDAHPLIEHWDGTSWTEVPEAAPQGEGIYPFLYGVTAVAADDIYAVGTIVDHNAQSPLIEHWDGSTWSLQHLDAPPDSRLSGIDATGPQDIWAVGSWIYEKRQRCCIENYHGLVAHFDGSGWTTVKTAREPAESTTLGDMAAIAPDDAWAVGTERDPTPHTVTEHWDGHRWHRVAAPDHPGGSNYLGSVAALGPDLVLAGGQYDAGSSGRCLSLLWDGQHWILIHRHRT